MQVYTSEKTSRNQLPRLFKKIEKWEGVNLDLGGGKYDQVQNYFNEKGFKCENLVYDPFNRSDRHNASVINRVKRQKTNTCTICNVLNVIQEESVQLSVLHQSRDWVKTGGVVFITVYEGDGSGLGKPTVNGYQHNKKIIDYLPLVKKVFPSAYLKNGVIFASK